MDLESIKYHLEEAMQDVLYGPSSDPLFENLSAAAHIFMSLREMEPDYMNDDVYRTLKGDNLYNEDFLPEIDEPVAEEEEL